MMEVERISETSVYSNETTQRYIPEDSMLHILRRENLVSHITLCVYSGGHRTLSYLVPHSAVRVYLKLKTVCIHRPLQITFSHNTDEVQINQSVEESSL
jgi:hypothetical protein